MADCLGQKIKKIRKELKMTQTQLAGNEMTKSMLSQIENNLAMPSMKNLQYLAFRLGKPASYFLEEDIQQGLPMEIIHDELREAAGMLAVNKFQEARVMLEAIAQKYNFDRGSKLYADFLSSYGECFIELNNLELGREKIKEAVAIYQNKFLYIEAAKTHLILAGIPWKSFDYVTCMDILEEAIKLYGNAINKDYPFEIETLYMRAILYAGLDQLKECLNATTEALEISKRTNIYYRSDELYKNLASMNFFMDNYDHFKEYMEKASQFAIFSENNRVLASLECLLSIYENQMGEPEKAIVHLNKALGFSEVVSAFIYSEMVKTNYMMGKYQEALDIMKSLQLPNYTPFKYDYIMLWRSKTYEALCLNKLKKPKEALGAVKQGIQKMEIIGESKTLAHAYKTLSDIYSDMGDYENAFSTLKRANEIEDIAKTKKLYY